MHFAGRKIVIPFMHDIYLFIELNQKGSLSDGTDETVNQHLVFLITNTIEDYKDSSSKERRFGTITDVAMASYDEYCWSGSGGGEAHISCCSGSENQVSWGAQKVRILKNMDQSINKSIFI